MIKRIVLVDNNLIGKEATQTLIDRLGVEYIVLPVEFNTGDSAMVRTIVINE